MFFDEKVEARVTNDLREKIALALIKDSKLENPKYENESHYVRVAIIEKLRKDGVLGEVLQNGSTRTNDIKKVRKIKYIKQLGV